MKSFSKPLAVALLGGGAAVGGFVGSALVRDANFARAEQQVQVTREQLSTINDLSTVFRNVGKAVEPSVVNINVRKTVKGPTGRPMPFPDDMLRRFFHDQIPGGPNGGNGDGEGEEQQAPDNNGNNNNNGGPNGGGGGESFEQVGTGSGVIMEVNGKTGYILTNNHVAGGATEMVVTLSDGRRIENAKLVGADPKSDLAVVKIEADHLIPAQWGDSASLEKGDWVLAFGSPFGYVGSMTHGIVSALDRSNVGILGAQGYEDFIQVDAPINPGNSGGPLVNVRGEVVGINTAIATRSGGFQGIGFAIPSNEAKFVYASLKDKGKVTRGWLGVSISDVAKNAAEARSFGYTSDNGVLVEQTFPNTPATNKLQPGDIVTQLNGKPVNNVLQLRNAIAATPPDTDVTMQVFRDGKTQDVNVRLGTQPENLVALASQRGANPGSAADNGAEAFGMQLATPNDELVQKFGLAETKGALVTNVQRGSAAAKAGIQPGDLITRVGNVPVTNAKQAGDILGKQDKKGVRLYVTNSEGSRFVFVEPTK